ncbi:MAG: hypothetical protein JWO56_2443 [Acidobacteria bacterium]|nr:hypothetical protein [Acidobacteriota bacterium]
MRRGPAVAVSFAIMPRIDITHLPDDARIWLFGISPQLDDSQSATLLGQVDAFLDSWAAHGTPIGAARSLVDHTFLVVGIDKQAEASGCSIDRMFGLLRNLERDLGVKILDSDRVFFRHGDGRIDATSRARFASNADKHTIVFDTTAERLGEIRGGDWEKRAEDSWHASLL